MSRLLVAVPSLGRPYEIERHTGFWLKQLEKYDWRVFIEPSERIYYSQIIPMNRLVITQDGAGLKGQIRNIRKYADEKGHEFVMKCDDDMWFLKRGAKKERSAQTLESALDEIIYQFDNDEKLGGASITKAAGYMRNSSNSIWVYKSSKPFYSNSISRTKLFDVPDAADVFIDLCLSLECVTKGYHTRTYARAYESCLTFKNKGGFQTTNRDSLSRMVFNKLKSVYPEISERVDTKNPCFDIDVSEYFKK
tara:strand:- start:3020 stop:3769 length:750 start_codon:yes stop_codon:yes gene_type:complete